MERDKSKCHDLYLMIKVSESTINTMFPGVPSHAIIYGKRENVDKRFLYSQISVMR